jgi:hypothetical protein
MAHQWKFHNITPNSVEIRTYGYNIKTSELTIYTIENGKEYERKQEKRDHDGTKNKEILTEPISEVISTNHLGGIANTVSLKFKLSVTDTKGNTSTAEVTEFVKLY